MRISEVALATLGLLLAVSACTAAQDDSAAKADVAQSALGPIECALQGAAGFTRDCTVERIDAGTGAELIVRHPDGGFRRFEVLPESRGLAPADGAEPAQTEWREGGIGLVIGADRYRFPATLFDNAAR